MYQHSCHNTAEAHSKLAKCKEKVDGSKGTARKKKAQEKEQEVSGHLFGQASTHPLPYDVFMSWLALTITVFVLL